MDGIDYIVSYIDFSQKEIKDLYREVAGEEYASNVNSDYLDFTLTLKLILKNPGRCSKTTHQSMLH